MNATQIAETKAALQEAFRTQWYKHNCVGTLAGATGFGKTKPAIDEMMKQWRVYKADLIKESEGWMFMFPLRAPSIFLAVPTEKLRDEGWPDEVRFWYGDEGMEMWNTCVEAQCYISLHKIRNKHFSLVIMDEIHNITILSNLFFKQNTYTAVMGLTATVPDAKRDPDKHLIIQSIAPVVFVYTLDQGVEDGTVADFRINVVYATLDAVTRNITAGTKAKPFLTTEKGQYEYLTTKIDKMFVQQGQLKQSIQQPFADPSLSKDLDKLETRIQFDLLARTRFIYNLPSKTRLAARMMKQLVPNKRTIIFCGSIAQSKILCGDEVYNSKENTDSKFEKFKAGEGQFLGVVNAANEGHNIANLDQALIVQVNSNERHLVQRIGRAVRAREGHVADIWIICVRGTVDEKWVEKALTNFNKDKIFYHDSSMFNT